MAEKKSIEQFFMVENVDITKQLVVSERFKGPDGKGVRWTIKAIPECVNKVLKNKNMRNGQLDIKRYQGDLMSACIVSPDLQNRALQDHYNAFTADELLGKMLTAGEYTYLESEIAKINGFDSLIDKVNEVKNV